MRVFIHIFDLCTPTRKFIAHRRFDGSFVFVECDYLFAFFCADIISHDDIHDVEIFLVFERLYELRRIFIVRAFIKLRTDYHNRICELHLHNEESAVRLSELLDVFGNCLFEIRL